MYRPNVPNIFERSDILKNFYSQAKWTTFCYFWIDGVNNWSCKFLVYKLPKHYLSNYEIEL